MEGFLFNNKTKYLKIIYNCIVVKPVKLIAHLTPTIKVSIIKSYAFLGFIKKYPFLSFIENYF